MKVGRGIYRVKLGLTSLENILIIYSVKTNHFAKNSLNPNKFESFSPQNHEVKVTFLLLFCQTLACSGLMGVYIVRNCVQQLINQKN